MSSKQRLALSIIDFLSQSKNDGSVKQDDQESLDIAVQCLEQAFELESLDETQRERLSVKPASLQSIFDVYLKTREMMGTQSASTSAKSAPCTSSSSASATSESALDDKTNAEKLKAAGNTHMSGKNYPAAIESYTQAIALDPTNAIYYSNRSAAYSSQGEYASAAADAEKALEVDPSFVRAYHRLGHARYCLDDYKGAAEAFRSGLAIDSTSASLKQGLQLAEARISNEDTEELSTESSAAPRGAGGMPDLASLGGAGGMPDLANLMSNPMMAQMAQQLMQNGGMERLMSNPSVANMMNRVQSGGGMPSMAELMSDPTLRGLASQFGAGAGR